MKEVVVFINALDILIDDSSAGNLSLEKSLVDGFDSRFLQVEFRCCVIVEPDDCDNRRENCSPEYLAN